MRTPAFPLLLATALLIAGCASVSDDTPVTQDDTMAHDDSMAHSDPAGADDHSAMAHDAYEIAAEGAPTVSVTVTEDAVSGFNVHIDTDNWTWAPEHVNGDIVEGEGHAHLYVDGVKLTRVYGSDLYVSADDATAASHFSVTLNANNHSEYAIDGESIAASAHVSGHDH